MIQEGKYFTELQRLVCSKFFEPTFEIHDCDLLSGTLFLCSETLKRSFLEHFSTVLYMFEHDQVNSVYFTHSETDLGGP
jgi:hypothetical protein